uniref:NAC domain-containing protein n=1 Tax=Kalanchoe fedtschenkoi TaxID=63787 RepID=A0A7N0TK81_KALFE
MRVMEKEKQLNFVRDGVCKLPPGFRFEPTDEEIVFQYLKCKVFGLPLPASVIPEINLCRYHPWELPGESEQDKYFFCHKNMNVSRSNCRAARNGYWKSTGEDRLIISSSTVDDRIIGLRKTSVFCRGKSSWESTRSDWIMHEYHLLFTCSSARCKSQAGNSRQSFLMMKEGWTICHIFQKNKKPRSCKSVTRNKRTRDFDSADGFKFLKLDNGGKTTPSSSSSSSSSVTEKYSA